VAVSLRVREMLALTTVVLLVVVVLTLAHLAGVAQVMLGSAGDEGRLLARQLFHQAARVVAEDRAATPDVLRSDANIRALMEGMVGYSRVVVYAAVVDPAGRAVVHSDPMLEGRSFGPRRTLDTVLESGTPRMLVALLGLPQIYEVQLPIRRGEAPFATISVGISTSLVRQELREALVRSVALGVAALVIAVAVGLGAGRMLLESLRQIARRVERLAREGLARGDFGGAVELRQGEDMVNLADRVNRLGEQIQAEPAPAGATAATGTIQRLEDAVVFLGADREVVFLNQAAERVLGLDLDSAKGRSLATTLPPDHPLLEVEARLFTTSEPERNRPVSVAAADGPREMVVSSYRLQDGDHAGGAVLVLKDLSPLRAVESIVTYSQKIASLGRLTSGVAHEVKNPLNAMRIHLELLRTRLGQDRPDVADNVEVIGESLQRLDRVVQGFLRFMRPQDLRLQPLDANALVGEVARIAETEVRAAGVTVDLDLASDLPLVAADQELIQQAVSNLATNGIQAMAPGGTLTLGTRRAPDGGVEIRVVDQGTGIAPEDLDRVFRLYYTTKPGGSGIGLSLVYRIVQMHDGRIDVDSTVGKGTTMTVTLGPAPVP
jgi:signal transduction histidine kinase